MNHLTRSHRELHRMNRAGHRAGAHRPPGRTTRLTVEQLESRTLLHGSLAEIDIPIRARDNREEHWFKDHHEAQIGTDADTGILGQVQDPAVSGRWGPVVEWPILAIHASLLPTGKVIAWEGTDSTVLFDPATDSLGDVADPNYNHFCSGHAFLADGKLLVAGGHIRNGVGLRTSGIYDPITDTWKTGPEMYRGRWYPTNTSLANGDVLTTSGSYDRNYTSTQIPEVWQADLGSWRQLTGANRPDMPLYPFMHLAPNGKVFNSGPNSDTMFLDTTGTGSWSNVDETSSGIWRDYGTSVMYEPGKVLLIGGGNPPTASNEKINLSDANPTWQPAAPMSFARRQHNATILPDGAILATGGTSSEGFNDATGSVLAAELWNPTTNTWTTLASMRERRLYHSTAVLLPDGRVLSAGGGSPAGTGDDQDHLNSEIFSPPYLFKGNRPTIASAPSQVDYAESFEVATPEAAAITDVTLVRLSSVTHAFNQNQRFARLPFANSPSGLNVTAPLNANLAPPGHYMLFLLNSAGVPSVAKIIQVGQAPTESAPNVDDTELIFNSRGALRRVVVTFNKAIDPARATNGSNYELRFAGGDGQFGTTDDRILRIRSRQYDSVTRSVTLNLSRVVAISELLRLTVIGTPTATAPGIADSFGNLLDGDNDGNPQGNFVALFPPQ